MMVLIEFIGFFGVRASTLYVKQQLSTVANRHSRKQIFFIRISLDLLGNREQNCIHHSKEKILSIMARKRKNRYKS